MTSGKAIVLPIRYPRELLRAFGFEPVEIWGPPKVEGTLGGSHLQPYICSVVKNALSFLLEDGLDDAEIILVPHCCDSLQGLGSLLLDFIKPKQKVLTFYPPRNKTEAAKNFLIAEIERLWKELEEITGKSPSQQDLMRCILEEEMADRLTRELYMNRERIGLSSREFIELLRKREYLHPKEFAKEVQDKLKITKEKEEKVRLILSGVLPEPMEVLDEIDAAGGMIVTDDTSCLRRRLLQPGTSNRPFERMAERLLSAPPDPVLGCSLEERIAFLEKLIEESNAVGVIFYNVKFCEGEDFYYPQVAQWLKSRGIKTLKIEADISPPLPKQVSQRIRAFIESLGGRA